MRNDRSSERGVALLIVAIALAALSLIVAAVVATSRQFGRETASAEDTLGLRAALDAGFATAAHDLAAPSGAIPALLSGEQQFDNDGATVRYRARPETGKIDLNAAPPALVADLLEVRGFDRTYSEEIARELADWRNAKTGGESDGASIASSHRALATESEIALLAHANTELATCFAPDVTVYTGVGQPYLPVATEAVKKAVAAFAPTSTSAQSPFFASLVNGRATLGDVFALDVTASRDGRIYAQRSVVRVTGDARDPVWILARSPIPSDAETEHACAEARKRAEASPSTNSAL